MLQIIQVIGHNLQSIVEQGGYFFLFFTTVLEGIPIVGQFIPGHTIVIISGFLAKLHVMNIWNVIVIVIVSAMIGDVIGFLIGRKYGLPLLYKLGPYFFIKKEYIEKVQNLISKNLAKTVLIGRFSPITRPLAPFLVGASGTGIKAFWIYNFFSVTAWSLFSISIGYIFGASYHAVSAVVGKYVLVAIIIGILMSWGYRFINKQFHIFAKYELITLGINLAGLYLFFKTIQDALTDKVFLLELDLFINNFFFTHATVFWIYFMNAVTNILSPIVLGSIGILGIIYFVYKKNYQYSMMTILSFTGGYIITVLIKNLVLRLRPEDALILETGYSFPSGHAIAATIFFVLFCYFYIINIRSLILRESLIVLSVLLVALTAFSRVYLGVHWLSDVLAGIGFGLFWSTLCILLVKYVGMIVKRIKEENRGELLQ